MTAIAMLCSDLHFSHRPPVTRSAEPDWYAAMERQWEQVREIAKKERIPVVVAGDIFDVWKSPPELVNFVIRLFRGLEVYAVPGQHDLPNHVYEDLHRSSYGTLVEAEAIVNVDKPDFRAGDNLRIYPAAWGFDIWKCKEHQPSEICLLVAHRYVWMNERTCYPGAPKEQHLAVLKKQLEGYDAAVFGDNHKGFLAQSGNCSVLNCGGFMPRKSDERSYKPRVGLLMSDGEIDQVFLDTSKDRWIDLEDEAELIDRQFDLSGLVGEFESLGADALDFEDALIRMMEKNGTDESVRQKVVAALQKGREDEAK
jgi:predicted phosphodiesterase